MQIEEHSLSESTPFAWDVSDVNGAIFWTNRPTVIMGDNRSMNKKVTVLPNIIYPIKNLPIDPVQMIWFQAGGPGDTISLMWW